ncbi:YhfT family protein [Bacillus cereus]|uniref:YhfT family protein n=1 Tax=Bacillus cereus TaxID=1396 RepID=UPI00366D42E7
MKLLLMILIGALAALLANRRIAVFNDGIRPLVAENVEGRLDQKTLILSSFSMSIVLLIGFGLPFSLTVNILLIHTLLLGTDIIGLLIPRGKWGETITVIIGGAYGAAINLTMEFIHNSINYLPINMISSLEMTGTPVIYVFIAIPSIAVALQFGIGKGLLTFVASFLARQTTMWVYENYEISIEGSFNKFSPESSALLTGMIFILVFSIYQNKAKSDVKDVGLKMSELFGHRIEGIQKNILYFMILGGLIAAATNHFIMAGDPISLQLLAEDKTIEAGLVSVIKALAFLPLMVGTAITTGVYGPVGLSFIFAAGMFLPNEWIAGIFGSLLIMIELKLLRVLANFLDSFPKAREIGENIRTAMVKVIEITFLIGSATASNDMVPGLGIFLFCSIYILNEVAGRPINRMAVGPIGVLVIGLLVSLFYFFGFISLPY